MDNTLLVDGRETIHRLFGSLAADDRMNALEAMSSLTQSHPEAMMTFLSRDMENNEGQFFDRYLTVIQNWDHTLLGLVGESSLPCPFQSMALDRRIGETFDQESMSTEG